MTSPSIPSSPDPRPRWPDLRPRGRPPLAGLLVASALLGGGTTAGILAVSGALDGGSTTVIERGSGAETTTTAASSGGLDAEALYASASAGVVDITARSEAQSPNPFGGGQATASGTGFVVDEQGHIVTAAHVVDGARSVSVKLADGTSREATVLGTDDATDVAVLKLDPAGLELRPLELGSSASVDVGDDVAVIGDPFGYARSISTGIVSGVDRTIEAPNGFTVAHAIQTDAAMNPGNSGGPVLDADGRVVGIADQIAGSVEQSSGVGFAVPIDLVKSTLEQLKAGDDVEHAYLGVATADGSAGVTLGDVTAGGPAADAGLRAGDVVTEFDGERVADSNDLVAAIASHEPADEVTLTVKRGSDTRQFTVTLGTQPEQSASQD